uniref:Uncharacterized protein n=1 Tax=Lactuca sativa TaxID=4236 RepID=A0A9R1WI00_LACSA|nr:hypothetical protein LSAT_V11C100046610 [Lactuca sativa]
MDIQLSKPFPHLEHKARSQALLDLPAMPMLDLLDTFSKPVSGSSELQQSSGWFKVFTVATHQSYFDVDTSDVLERIKDSLLPFGGSFNEKTASNPDLMLLLFNKSQSYNLSLFISE